tara:strand:- start:38979 stop:39437 length:459 start_codon:yes stop_codon:yes gene_type:complete
MINENMNGLLSQLRDDYDLKTILCVNDAKDIQAICKTPYSGTYADVRLNLDVPTVAGVCPLCQSSMSQVKRGLYFCSKDHPLVKMTTPAFRLVRQMIRPSRPSRTVALPSNMTSRRPIVGYGKPLKAKPAIKETLNMEEVKDQLREALGDLL